MDQVKLGATGPRVGALGLGCMGMSDVHGPADRAESLATVRDALDRGIDLLDAGDVHGSGHNEILLREAVGAIGRVVEAGHRRPIALSEVGAATALAVTLTDADLAQLGAIARPGAAAGDRSDAHGMASLDSERGGKHAH